MQDLGDLWEASLPLLREEEGVVDEHVELALLPWSDLRRMRRPVDLGRETRSPLVVAASDGAVEDAGVGHDAQHSGRSGARGVAALAALVAVVTLVAAVALDRWDDRRLLRPRDETAVAVQAFVRRTRPAAVVTACTRTAVRAFVVNAHVWRCAVRSPGSSYRQTLCITLSEDVVRASRAAPRGGCA